METPERECANCTKKGTGFKRCSKCKKVWYCDQDCQKIHWSEHKKACGTSEDTKTDEEKKETEEEIKIPEPEWNLSITIYSKDKEPKNYSSKLSVHPWFSLLMKDLMRTVVENGDIVRIPLIPEDTVDLSLTNIKDETKSKEWKGITAEQFVKMTSCGKTEEQARFLNTGTRYDNWDHKDLHLNGMDLPKEDYPGGVVYIPQLPSEEIKEQTDESIDSPSKDT